MMLPVVIVAAVLGWLAAAFLVMRLNALQDAQPAQLTSPSKDAESKLEGLRKELTAAKEATERKSKQLEELRAESKKKARREGKKEQATEAPQVAAEPSDKEARDEISRLKKAILGLEKQIEITQKEAAATARDAEKNATEMVAGKLEAEKAKANAERANAKEAIDAKKMVEKTLEELRASIKKKAEARPDIPGSGLDLKALPTEVVQELARYFRKAEHFEKLHGVVQGQLQLAQDRFNEQQKRYFAVCRELAVVAGKTPGSDLEARTIAESATHKTNAAVAAAATPSSAVSADSADSDGDGEKKKKRRRRRKKKGDGVNAAGDEGSSADGHDDDGDDDGHDDAGNDSETAVAASDTATAASTDAPEAAIVTPAVEEKTASGAET